MSAADAAAKARTADRHVDATPEEIFALLVDPATHVRLDASDSVHGSRTPGPLTAVGDVFVMDMHGRDIGDYQVHNRVVVLEPDRALGWAPASTDGTPGGQTWTYRLTTEGGGTRLSQTYDWSQVTLERLLPYLPVVDADGLAASLDRVAELVEDRGSGRAAPPV